MTPELAAVVSAARVVLAEYDYWDHDASLSLLSGNAEDLRDALAKLDKTP